MAARTQVLTLYHKLLREGSKFHNYNFREYALRKTKDEFRAHRNEANQEQIGKLIKEAANNLHMLQRQVMIGNAFSHESVMNVELQKRRSPSSTS